MLFNAAADAVSYPQTQADAGGSGWLLGTPLGVGPGALTITSADAVLFNVEADAIAAV